jgi:response regulator RpfG family c-di-GMP phosphodiesterase
MTEGPGWASGSPEASRGQQPGAPKGGRGLGPAHPPLDHSREVLLVDDERQVLEILDEIFERHGYARWRAANGLEALEMFRAHPTPLVVTDLAMPVMGGLDFIRHARALDPDAAIVVLTGYGDVQSAIQSLKLGAHDYILKPVNVHELMIAADRALEHRELLRERRQYQAILERRVEEATRDLNATLRELESTYRATLQALASAIDTRDTGTEAHSRRVHGYSLVLARAHGVPEGELRDIEHGVLLHDIGKIGIPDAILLKAGPLTPLEWRTMRTHPEIGRKMLERIPFLRGAVPVVYHHHERWDGTGYPGGLKGAEIPIGARVFAVADAFDAMTVDRPYSRAISMDAAREEIRRSAGSHFDPAVVEAFLSVPLEVLEEIYRRSLE